MTGIFFVARTLYKYFCNMLSGKYYYKKALIENFSHYKIEKKRANVNVTKQLNFITIVHKLYMLDSTLLLWVHLTFYALNV